MEKQFAIKISSTVAECLEQPDHHYILTKIVSETTMTFLGTDDPCACIKVGLRYAITPKTNENTSRSLTELIQEELKIEKERIFVDLQDIGKTAIGYEDIEQLGSK